VDGILRLARSSDLEHEPVNIGIHGVHDSGVCAAGDGDDRIGERDPVRSAAAGRSQAAVSRYFESETVAGLEPKVELASGLKLSLEYFGG